MPGQDLNEALIKPYTFDVAVPQYAAVVGGAVEDHATLPAGANATKFVGFTFQGAHAAGEVGPVQKQGGQPYAIAAAAITKDDPCCIADAQGRIRTAAAGENVVCTAERTATATGDVIPVLITRMKA